MYIPGKVRVLSSVTIILLVLLALFPMSGVLAKRPTPPPQGDTPMAVPQATPEATEPPEDTASEGSTDRRAGRSGHPRGSVPPAVQPSARRPLSLRYPVSRLQPRMPARVSVRSWRMRPTAGSRWWTRVEIRCKWALWMLLQHF